MSLASFTSLTHNTTVVRSAYSSYSPAPTISILSKERPPVAWTGSFNSTDLAAFNISRISSGKHNLQVAKADPSNSTASERLEGGPKTFYDASVISVLYPAGSVNPGASDTPVGGAQFYSNPLGVDLLSAKNVSLEYSVYFPAEFDFVLGGKLPGIYGGHESCSGGDDALDCFSTRMMWRKDGMGELYLYAPKNKQTEGLCSLPPKSICASSYGLSIARGIFSFPPGQWTRLRQTVVLNTPGQQDGGFKLEVNDRVVLERDDVYYRGPVDEDEESLEECNEGESEAEIVNALDSDVNLSVFMTADGLVVLGDPSRAAADSRTDLDVPDGGSDEKAVPDATSSVWFTPEGLVVLGDSQVLGLAAEDGGDSDPDNGASPIGFSGLFFSTFFGGQGSQWATPKDQYVSFRDFYMTIHA